MSDPGRETQTPVLEPVDEPQPDRSVRRKFILTLVAIFAIGSFAMWIYILFIYDPGLLIDELPDKTFPTQAEEICAEAVAQVELLPPAETAVDNVERAEVVTEANAYLVAMVASLRPLTPTEDPVSVEAANEWLDDWEIHLEDRTEYAERLAEDPTARFTESTRAEKQISRAIDSYAQVNSMVSCATPGDVG